MAKRVVAEAYTFSPSTNTITVTGKWIRREQIILILNVTSNTVIYNFSSSSLGASAVTNAMSSGTEVTTIVVNYNCSGMGTSDKISIIVEETNETFVPAEAYRDPVEKLRISTPQALIDTDFEYGTQPTKWETIALTNNRPSAFYDSTQGISGISTTLTIQGNVGSYSITGISGAGTNLVTITMPNTVGITTSTPIYVQDTTNQTANGWYLPFAVTSNTSVTYYARGTVASGSIFDPTKTYLFIGSFYTQAGLAIGTNGITYSGTTATVTTQAAHGLTAGQAIYVVGTTASTNPPNGSYAVLTTPTSNTFTYSTANATGTPTGTVAANYNNTGGSASGFTVNTTVVSGAVTAVVVNGAGANYLAGDIYSLGGGTGGQVKITSVGTTGNVTGVQVFAGGSGYTAASAVATTALYSANTVFARTWGTSVHRAFDGGVTFTAGYPYHGNQLIRQTRRYFRYQSGKGIQMSTGSNLCNSLQVDGMTASGTTVTVTTKFVHNINTGCVIIISGADQSAYNGTFTVTSIPSDTSFTYTAASTPSPTTATTANSFGAQPYRWYGASVRLGMFDSQNGFFFEYDGQTLYAVRRSSTTQLPGYISTLYNGQQAVTGTGTSFTKQLKPGDFISIRGMTHTVVGIESDTSMTVYPDYKGVTIISPSQVIINKIVETRIPQSSWNIDKVDGSGSSGYNLDVSKMQMWYMDYAWYGAGSIRFGVKNNRGEVIYCHRLVNNNVNTEAYMRSGNLPARYEVNTFYPKTILASSVLVGDTTIAVQSTTGFPTSGNFIITAAATAGSGGTGAAMEYVSYTGISGNSFTGCTRGLTNLSGPGSLTNMGGAAATAFTYSATAPVSVQYWGPQCATTISHWGTSVIMDGRYDDDKSIQFNYGQNTPIVYTTAGTRYPVLSIRLAPSVDAGLIGLLGQREIINRMQLQPQSIGVYPTTAGVKVEVWLNARISGGTAFSSVGGSSLAQGAIHPNTATMTGGESIFTFFAPAAAVTGEDLSKTRDIGNSILGGGTTLAYPVNDANKYPDGPDTITIAITPIASNASVVTRINWTEAQA
jgi:hypothetical protein